MRSASAFMVSESAAWTLGKFLAAVGLLVTNSCGHIITCSIQISTIIWIHTYRLGSTTCCQQTTISIRCRVAKVASESAIENTTIDNQSINHDHLPIHPSIRPTLSLSTLASFERIPQPKILDTHP